MSLPNDIVLRPRFKIPMMSSKEDVLRLFQKAKESSSNFILSCVDDHVFIKIPKKDQHFWSPQLHLEIIETEKDTESTLHGLFGPNPTVWTFFMFLHFVVAGLFIGFTIWAYTNWSLDQDFIIQTAVCIILVLIWFLLYAAGRLGRATGKEQMHELNDFMYQILNTDDD